MVGGDGVWGVVAPVPFVVGGFQCDGDVVSEQVDRVGLCGVGGCHDRGNVLVRVRDVWGLLVDPCAIRADGDGGTGVRATVQPSPGLVNDR